MNLQSLYWTEPLWLLLALQPVIIFLFKWLQARKQLSRYANPALHPWVVKHRHRGWRQQLLNRNSGYFAAWLCIAIAAAGPRLVEEVPDNTASHGVDIMAVVDISRSMHVRDISPSRLGRAKQELQTLTQQLQKDRLGLIVYAAHAHQYMPLSHDKKVMQHYLENLDNLSPPTQGSQPLEALRLAEQLLQQQDPSTTRSKAILLLSDGENLQTPTDIKTPVFVLGLGSIEGDAVPGYEGDWIQDDNRVIVSRLHEEELSGMAKSSHGRYSRAYKDNSDWASLYTNGIQAINHDVSISKDDKVTWHELYAYALLPGLLLLLISTLSFKAGTINLPATKLAILVLCIAGMPIPDAQANDSTAAYQSFIENDHLTALEKYRAMEGYSGRFGEGASAYRLQDSARAIAAFNQAFLAAQDDRQRAAALYNLGNSHFQNGDYPAAISSYQGALIYQPGHVAALKNMAFSQVLQDTVQKRLARLQKLLSPGRGPKQASADANTPVGEDSSLSIDDSNGLSDKSAEDPLGYADSLPEDLILKGIAHAQLASEELTATASANNETERPGISRQQLDVIRDNQKAFWDRILEIEEGFPAPLSQPRQVKGIESW